MDASTTPIEPLAHQLATRVADAVARAHPDAGAVDPQIRRSDHADYQANGIMPLAGRLRRKPRDVAADVAAAIDRDGLLASIEVSGPGFINLTLSDAALLGQLDARAGDARLGLGRPEAGVTTVIDYSQPNIAKEMHVGHLRSTIIGDALVRVLEFLGGEVIRRNHLGDWGTQFGMLIQYAIEHPELQWRGERADGVAAMSRLDELYRASRTAFDVDEEFAERSRRRVVELQSGDEETLAAWREMVAESKLYFNEVYDRLDVTLTDEDAVGESAYDPLLAGVVDDLERSGVAVRSDGALCVFFDDIVGPDGAQIPLIVRKRDGGYGYATTDLAAIRNRIDTLSADRLLYVVDARQALHFRMVFEAARRAGWLPDDVSAIHAAFGAVLGRDGRPFKTREGDTVRLIELLDDAVAHAERTVRDKSGGTLDEAALHARAHEVGIGAVKYADLATSRTRDYTFDVDRMVSLTGNTGVYLQYAHARIRSILRRLPDGAAATASVHPELALEPAERALAIALDELPDTVLAVAEHYEPHRLCTYLHSLAQTFSDFYESCPVLKAPSAEVRDNRVVLCRVTGDTLALGLRLLGIATPERL